MAHIQVPGTLTFDLTAPFTQQGIYNAIKTAYPTDPSYTVVSIAVPLVHINCLEFGLLDPESMIKDAAGKLYNHFMQLIVKPIWDAFYALYNVLKSFGLAVLDITIPVLGLTIADLFSPDLFEKIKAKVLSWYDSATQTFSDALKDLLKILDIPWPLFDPVTIKAPQFDIEYIINSILGSLWAYVLKLIKKVIGLISTGLRLWELATQEGRIVFSQLWDMAVDAVIGYILGLLITVPSVKDIYDALVAYAKSVYKKAVVTAEEILKVIKDFNFFGFKPFDWDSWEWNPHISMPEIDLMRILNSLLITFKNLLFSVINQLLQAVLNVFQFFGINLSALLKITVPITFCAVPND